MAIVDERYEGAHHFIDTQLSGNEFSDVLKGDLFDKLHNVFTELGIQPETRLGEAVISETVRRYKRHFVESRMHQPVNSVGEALWFCLTGQETSLSDNSFPDVRSKPVSSEQHTTSDLIPEGSTFICEHDKRLMDNYAVIVWSFKRGTPGGPAPLHYVIFTPDPNKEDLTPEEVKEALNTRYLRKKTIYVRNPVSESLRFRRIDEPDSRLQGLTIEYDIHRHLPE